MATVDEIHDAQQAVVKAALEADADDTHHTSWADVRFATLKLRALLSSLPSREEMAGRQCAFAATGSNSTELHASWAEYHWSECLQWLAVKMVERATGHRMEWEGGKLVSCPAEALVHEDELRDWADELEARSS